ncbi:MAG: hypothetical protein ACK5MI_04135 [Mangrovibacterium sp.]
MSIEIIGIILYFIVAVCYGWWASKVVAYSAATQYWGQRLANTRVVLQALHKDPDLNETIGKIDLFGFQQLLTCKVQRIKTKIRFLSNIPFFIVGAVFFEWYIPVLGIIVVLSVKYYFLNRSPESSSSEILSVIITDLEEELANVSKKPKVTSVEVREREFFVNQLKCIQQKNYAAENSAVYQYKEIYELGRQ